MPNEKTADELIECERSPFVIDRRTIEIGGRELLEALPCLRCFVLEKSHHEVGIWPTPASDLRVELVGLVPIKSGWTAPNERVLEKASLPAIAECDVKSFERDGPSLGGADTRPVIGREPAQQQR